MIRLAPWAVPPPPPIQLSVGCTLAVASYLMDFPAPQVSRRARSCFPVMHTRGRMRLLQDVDPELVQYEAPVEDEFVEADDADIFGGGDYSGGGHRGDDDSDDVHARGDDSAHVHGGGGGGGVGSADEDSSGDGGNSGSGDARGGDHVTGGSRDNHDAYGDCYILSYPCSGNYM